MQSSILHQTTLATFLIVNVLLTATGASQVLSIRDQTCSDGGVCLDVDGNICCSGGDSGANGCMFSTGVCCGNGFWCYEGQYCSTTDPSANSDGDVNCCSDAACKNVVGGGEFLIFYSDQPGYTLGAMGSSSASAQTQSLAGSSSVPTNLPASSSSSLAVSTASTEKSSATTKATTTSSPNPASSTTSTSSTSPATTKASTGEISKELDLVRGLAFILAVMALGL